jgi:hypothetical protein
MPVTLHPFRDTLANHAGFLPSEDAVLGVLGVLGGSKSFF